MATLDLKPLATQDDGSHADPSTWSGTAVLVGVSGGISRDAWLRFPAATVPVGATINVAHIVLTATAMAGTAVASVIAGVDEDDHAAPTNDATWQTDHGIHTTATVDWDFAPAASGTQQTPSIVAIIQEIVDRAGWVSGNDIGIHIDDDGSAAANFQTWEDFGAAGTAEAVLHIEYTAGGATQTLTGTLFIKAPTFFTGSVGLGSTVTVSGSTVTIATGGTVTITGPGGVVYTGGTGTVILPAGSYTWTSTDSASGSFAIVGGGNRMGGSGAIRKPPRNVGR